MLTALVILFGLYFILLVLLTRGWRRAVQPLQVSGEVTDGPVTVIIAARNEENTIGELLEDLDRQRTNNFEVIVVDDHSEDNTAGVIKTWARKVGYPLTLINPGVLQGKKNSLSTGIGHARGPVVIVTDADCRVGDEWIASLRGCFENADTKFVAGAVRIQRDNTWRSALQATEFVSLVGTGAAAIGSGYPVMCNGANMAFRKETFLEVKGYEGNRHIASGDDEFLMNKIQNRYPGGVRFCSDSEATVETAAVSWREFISQRIRWAGKWKGHGLSLSAAIAIFVFSFHFSLLTIFPASLLAYHPLIPLSLLAVKAILEYSFLSAVCRFIGLKWNWPAFGLLQVIYPLYAVTIGIAANVGATTWKGRKIKSGLMEMHSPLAENR